MRQPSEEMRQQVSNLPARVQNLGYLWDKEMRWSKAWGKEIEDKEKLISH
jgi:hypothetical protein